MSGERDDADGWPVELHGVTESIVSTLGPNERWNVAALGLHAGDPVTGTTWGRTRTWRNLTERGRGYVQFSPDPVDFAEAALSIREEDEPILDSADAWVEVSFESRDDGEDSGTQWVEWALKPVKGTVEHRGVRTINRGYYAVIEATVAASRLGVDAYDQDALSERLDYFEGIVEKCGGPREHEAFEVVREQAEW